MRGVTAPLRKSTRPRSATLVRPNCKMWAANSNLCCSFWSRPLCVPSSGGKSSPPKFPTANIITVNLLVPHLPFCPPFPQALLDTSFFESEAPFSWPRGIANSPYIELLLCLPACQSLRTLFQNLLRAHVQPSGHHKHFTEGLFPTLNLWERQNQAAVQAQARVGSSWINKTGRQNQARVGVGHVCFDGPKFSPSPRQDLHKSFIQRQPTLSNLTSAPPAPRQTGRTNRTTDARDIFYTGF